MTDVVLDASAVLAYLHKETGADVVYPHLRGGRLCAVNYSEVLARGVVLGINPAVTEGFVLDLGIVCVPFEERLAAVAASFVPMTKPFGLSLADRACLALGAITGLPVLTGDRDWVKVGLEQEIRLIR